MLCMILLIALFFYYYFLKTTKKVFDAQEAWQEKFEDTKCARGKIVRHLGNAISISKESKTYYLPDPSCPQEMPEDPYPYFPLRIIQENPRLGAV